MKNYVFLLIFALFLTGCASKALNYEPQEIKRDYNATWQYNFNIAELDTLIYSALKNNEDIATASLNLHQAMLRAGLSKADLFPTPSANMGASSSRNINNSNPSNRSFNSQVALSWELDLWGRILDSYESASFSAIASSLSLQDLQESIINSVILSYFNILYLNEMKENLLINYENMSKLHELVRIKTELGKEEPLALLQSSQNLLSLQNSLNSTNKDINATYESLKNLTRIELLPSGKISAIALPSVDLGLVMSDGNITFSWIDRIKNRPDVNMALANLNAGFYDYRVAQKAFLPRISLGGSLSDSDKSADKSFGFNLLSGNISITLPFLDFYRLNQNLKISEDEFNKLRLNYEKTLNNAVNESIKYASYYEMDTQNLANNEQIVLKRENILSIYEQKYNAGRVEFRDLLNAQNDLLSARNSFANSKYQLLNDIIGFYKASAYGGILEF